jgi:hypothetical protein
VSEALTHPAPDEMKLLKRVQGLVDYLYDVVDQELVTQRLARLAWDA